MTFEQWRSKRENEMPSENEKYYKVLMNGKSFHGGSLEWSLPKGDKPGEWHESKGVLSLCDNGLHVTKTPAAWWADGAECFEVEWAGDKIDVGNKAVVKKCRLVRMLTDDDLCKLGIFRSGSHKVKGGTVAASGSACVMAYGSTRVRAYGSASVTASGYASVTAYGSACVRAQSHSTVNTHSAETNVETEGHAVHIDRSVLPPVIRTGWTKS